MKTSSTYSTAITLPHRPTVKILILKAIKRSIEAPIQASIEAEKPKRHRHRGRTDDKGSLERSCGVHSSEDLP